ncbi:MAG TPA: hypothetical protein VIG51_13175 [Candidatus Baltobacteraceae bacterium]
MIARGVVLVAANGLIEARMPAAALGDGVAIVGAREIVYGSVVAIRTDRVTVAPYGTLDGVSVGDAVHGDTAATTLPLGMAVLGRAIDARGSALDGRGPVAGIATRIGGESLLPAQRRPIDYPLWTGVRVIDALLTVGRGARLGLFGGPGVGKSTLLHMLTRGAHADAVVVGLIGERGREAETWMRGCDSRTTIVCATGDRCASERVRAARIALAQAHALRSRGLHVLVILDSLARFGAALREVAVATGESVGRGGYPASVFHDMARLLESAGATPRGSITLLATVLSDGDERDPLSDAARSLLDGHIALSADIAHAGRFPAIDVPASVSRTMTDVVDAEQARHARSVRAALATLARTADARALGIVPVEPLAQRAVGLEASIEHFLAQGDESADPATTRADLATLADNLEDTSWTSRPK